MKRLNKEEEKKEEEGNDLLTSNFVKAESWRISHEGERSPKFPANVTPSVPKNKNLVTVGMLLKKSPISLEDMVQAGFFFKVCRVVSRDD